MRCKCCPPLPQKEGIKKGRDDVGDIDGDGVGIGIVLHGFSSLYIGCKRAFHKSEVGITTFDGESDVLLVDEELVNETWDSIGNVVNGAGGGIGIFKEITLRGHGGNLLHLMDLL